MNEFPGSRILDTEIVGRLLRIELHGPGRDIRSPVSVLDNIRDKIGIYVLQYPSQTVLEIRRGYMYSRIRPRQYQRKDEDICFPVSVLDNIRDKTGIYVLQYPSQTILEIRQGYMFSSILDNIRDKSGVYVLQYPSQI